MKGLNVYKIQKYIYKFKVGLSFKVQLRFSVSAHLRAPAFSATNENRVLCKMFKVGQSGFQTSLADIKANFSPGRLYSLNNHGC